MAIVTVSNTNPIITSVMASAWVTKGKSVTFSQIIWRDLTTAGGTLVLTNGGVTTTLSNILIKRTYDGTAVLTIKAMNVIPQPITVSKMYIHTNFSTTNCAGGTLEFWKE